MFFRCLSSNLLIRFICQTMQALNWTKQYRPWKFHQFSKAPLAVLTHTSRQKIWFLMHLKQPDIQTEKKEKKSTTQISPAQTQPRHYPNSSHPLMIYCVHQISWNMKRSNLLMTEKSNSDMHPVYKYRSLGLFCEQKRLLIEESHCLRSVAPLFL